jgi:hypothetical protein
LIAEFNINLQIEKNIYITETQHATLSSIEKLTGVQTRKKNMRAKHIMSGAVSSTEAS